MNVRNCIALVAALITISAASAGLAETTLLASYSLNNTAADATGSYGDLTLVNTPYEDGGIYANGIYQGDGWCSASTPPITGLDMTSFTLSVEFKVSDFPTLNPVLIGSSSWRWIGAMVDWNEELQLIYNSTRTPSSDTLVTVDEWHTVVLTYDGTTGTLYMDGQLVIARDFDLNDGGDQKICITHGGNGVTFKGHLRNLEIFNGIPESVPAVNSSFGAVKAKFRN